MVQFKGVLVQTTDRMVLWFSFLISICFEAGCLLAFVPLMTENQSLLVETLTSLSESPTLMVFVFGLLIFLCDLALLFKYSADALNQYESRSKEEHKLRTKIGYLIAKFLKRCRRSKWNEAPMCAASLRELKATIKKQKYKPVDLWKLDRILPDVTKVRSAKWKKADKLIRKISYAVTKAAKEMPEFIDPREWNECQEAVKILKKMKMDEGQVESS